MKIINTYHTNFGGGIGDFLRGSVHLHSLCKKYDINFSIDWKYHTIGKYISSSEQSSYNMDYILDVEKLAFKQKNNRPFNNRLKSIINLIAEKTTQTKPDNKNPVLMSSYYLDIYGDNPLQKILSYDIPDDTKNFLKNNLIVCEKIKTKHKKTINKIQDYGTIHFRLGDRQTLPNFQKTSEKIPQNILNNYNLREIEHDFDFLYFLIERNLEDNNLSKIILLSDCNKFKKYVSQKNNSKIIITHFDSVHSS